MIAYEREKHEALIVHWWYRLSAEDTAKLFDGPLRNLTSILHFFAHEARLFFKADGNGVWLAAWYQPYMGAWWLAGWIREDRRRTRDAYRGINEAMELGLKESDPLLCVTAQRGLDRFLRHCGFTRMTPEPIPGLMDKNGVLLYAMTRKSRDGKKFNPDHGQPIRADAGGVWEVGAADVQADDLADRGGAPNGRDQRGDSNHQSERGRGARRLFDFFGKH